MKLFAGIDGGQSSTTAVIANEDGRILGRGHGGPADEVGQDASSTRLHDALAEALASASVDAKIDPDSTFESIVAGVSGYEGRVYGKPPALAAKRFQLMHDAPIAHAGAFAGSSGIVVIAGTGSVGYGVNDLGETITLGGWGYLFGDEGSAFAMMRAIISDAAHDSDAGDRNELCAFIVRELGCSSLRELVRAFYTNAISRESLAACAESVVKVAERGGSKAVRYCRDAAYALARLAAHSADRLAMEHPQVAFTGGLMRNGTMRELAAQSLHLVLPSAQSVKPRYDAATGALLLAYKAVGAQLPKLTA